MDLQGVGVGEPVDGRARRGLRHEPSNNASGAGRLSSPIVRVFLACRTMLERRAARRDVRRRAVRMLVQVGDVARCECDRIERLGSDFLRTGVPGLSGVAASASDTSADIADVVAYAALLTRHVRLIVDRSNSVWTADDDEFVSNAQLVARCVRTLASIRRTLEYRVNRQLCATRPAQAGWTGPLH